MKYSNYIDEFRKELEVALYSLNEELGKKAETLAYVAAIGNAIVASGRLRMIPRLESKDILLLEESGGKLAGIRWSSKLMGYAERCFTERLTDCEKYLGKFEDGLESLGYEQLSKLAREVVLSRDAISLLTAWQTASGRKFPGTKGEDHYPFDERIRELLPDMDLYLYVWREAISSLPDRTWVWKERLGCLSSVALVQILEGSYHDMKSGKAHLSSCRLCEGKYRPIDIPKLVESIFSVAVHPSENEFTLYRRLQLSEPARKAIERHVASCRRCKALVSVAPSQVETVTPVRKKIAGTIVKFSELYGNFWENIQKILDSLSPLPAPLTSSGVEEPVPMWRDRLLRKYLWRDPEASAWMVPKPGGLEIYVNIVGKKAPLSFQVTDASGIRLKWNDTNREKSENTTKFSIDIRQNPLPLTLTLRCGKYRKSILLER